MARVPVVPYAAATVVGILPGTAILSYFADSVLAGVGEARTRAVVHTVVAGLLLLALSFAPVAFRRH
jgi:uncharacterized membrane protein YdjX (TVP38/TMEM64 family)